jgi:hypothetical protein
METPINQLLSTDKSTADGSEFARMPDQMPDQMPDPLSSSERSGPGPEVQQEQRSQQRSQQRDLQEPITNVVPSGLGQGQQKGPGAFRKEMFTQFDFNDLKSIAVVFGIMLFVAYGIPSSIFRTVNLHSLIQMDGKLNLLGAVIVSIIGSLLFFVITYFSKI